MANTATRPGASTALVVVLICLLVASFLIFATTNSQSFEISNRMENVRDTLEDGQFPLLSAAVRRRRHGRVGRKTCKCSKSVVTYYAFDLPSKCRRNRRCACSIREGDAYKCDKEGLYTCAKVVKPKKVWPVGRRGKKCRRMGPRRYAHIPVELILEA